MEEHIAFQEVRPVLQVLTTVRVDTLYRDSVIVRHNVQAREGKAHAVEYHISMESILQSNVSEHLLRHHADAAVESIIREMRKQPLATGVRP